MILRAPRTLSAVAGRSGGSSKSAQVFTTSRLEVEVTRGRRLLLKLLRRDVGSWLLILVTMKPACWAAVEGTMGPNDGDPTILRKLSLSPLECFSRGSLVCLGKEKRQYGILNANVVDVVTSGDVCELGPVLPAWRSLSSSVTFSVGFCPV